MKAAVATGTASLVEIAEVADPEPSADEVLVAVRATSVNRGEVHRLLEATPGWRPGWDVAGKVVRRASDGRGPRPGTRVFGYVAGGAWSELVAMPLGQLAAMPPTLDDRIAATLPIAGVTALRTLRMGGELRGSRVLITGASGGVGRLAVQLATRAGASVAAVGSSKGGVQLTDLGADMSFEHIDRVGGQFDLIIESVGGASLGRACELVAAGGTIVTFGNSSRRSSTIDVSSFYPKQARLVGYYYLDDVLTRPVRPDLEELARMVARGQLRVDVGMHFGWQELGKAIQRLRNRDVQGKIVVSVASDPGGR